MQAWDGGAVKVVLAVPAVARELPGAHLALRAVAPLLVRHLFEPVREDEDGRPFDPINVQFFGHAPVSPGLKALVTFCLPML